jgi:hypothetical protein
VKGLLLTATVVIVLLAGCGSSGSPSRAVANCGPNGVGVVHEHPESFWATGYVLVVCKDGRVYREEK